jgi:hypothetical protein
MNTNYDPVNLEEQQKTIDERTHNEKIEKLTEDDDLRWLMGQKRGRRIVWWFLSLCKVYQDPFDTNALSMARNCGAKQFGILILARILQICPNDHATMTNENSRNNATSREHTSTRPKPK